MPIDKHHTGQDARLSLSTGGNTDLEDVPISNVDWSRDVNTTDNQLNDDLKAAVAVTGLRYSGSFEYDGKNDDVRSLLWNDADDTDNSPRRFTLTVKETVSDETTSSPVVRYYTFQNVTITSESRSIPGDDNSSTTYDWSAEDVTVTTA